MDRYKNLDFMILFDTIIEKFTEIISVFHDSTIQNSKIHLAEHFCLKLRNKVNHCFALNTKVNRVDLVCIGIYYFYFYVIS